MLCFPHFAEISQEEAVALRKCLHIKAEEDVCKEQVKRPWRITVIILGERERKKCFYPLLFLQAYNRTPLNKLRIILFCGVTEEKEISSDQGVSENRPIVKWTMAIGSYNNSERMKKRWLQVDV